MAVSCLEQRLTPLTDTVPTYAPWGPFGVPPFLDEGEDQEEEPVSPLGGRRRGGRRCKTWGGYIPHALEGDASNSNVSTANTDESLVCHTFDGFEQPRPEHHRVVIQRDVTWYGRDDLEDNFQRADQPAPSSAAVADAKNERYFGTLPINAGIRRAGGYGKSPDPAYVCNLVTYGQPEHAPRLPDRATPFAERAAPFAERAAAFADRAASYPERAAPFAERTVAFADRAAAFNDRAAALADRGAPFVEPPMPFREQEEPFRASPFASAVGLAAPYATAASAPEVRPERQHGNKYDSTAWISTDPKAATVDAGVTTLMIQNLPPHISQRELLFEIDKRGFTGLYNFCHLPMSFDTGKNKGFAFINFLSADVAQSFHSVFHDNFTFANEPLEKALRIVTAEVQGFKANAAKALSKKMRRVRNVNFKPVLAGHGQIAQS